MRRVLVVVAAAATLLAGGPVRAAPPVASRVGPALGAAAVPTPAPGYAPAEPAEPAALPSPPVLPGAAVTRSTADADPAAARAAALLQVPAGATAEAHQLRAGAAEGPMEAGLTSPSVAARTVAGAGPGVTAGHRVASAAPDVRPLPRTPATTVLLDGAQGSGTVGSDAAPVVVGQVTSAAATTVAVTELDAHGSPFLLVGDQQVALAPGVPTLVQVGAGTVPVSVGGAPGQAVRIAVRTLRSGALTSAGSLTAELRGAGDAVRVPFAEPSGTVGVAVRLTVTGGRAAAALDRASTADADGGVQADVAPGGFPTAQGLPVELPSGDLLLWAPEPLHQGDAVDVPVTLTVLRAALLTPAAGTTLAVQRPADQPVLVRMPFSDASPGTFTVLAAASGHLVPSTTPLGLAPADPTLRRTYLVGSPDEAVASFGGTGTFGPPAAVDLSVHVEAVRTLAQASSTSLHDLAVDRPGLVFDVTAADLTADDLYTLDAGASSTVELQVCVVDGSLVCQDYAPGQVGEGAFLQSGDQQVLLVAVASRPDTDTLGAAPGSYGDTGTWSWRLVTYLVKAERSSVVDPGGPGDHSAVVHVPGLPASTGRLSGTSCGFSATLYPLRGAENQSGGSTSTTFRTSGALTVDLPVGISGSVGKEDGALPARALGRHPGLRRPQRRHLPRPARRPRPADDRAGRGVRRRRAGRHRARDQPHGCHQRRGARQPGRHRHRRGRRLRLRLPPRRRGMTDAVRGPAPVGD